MFKAILSTVIFYTLTLPAFAQSGLAGSPTTTDTTPLIYGASSGAPDVVAPAGQPPAIGSGSVPVGVTAGMLGPSTLLPSMPIEPANNIDYPSYVVPFNPASQSAPGTLGPSTYAPPAPSTPGLDPGIIHAPLNFYPPPVSVVPINPAGGIYGSAPLTRWGGQDTTDFGRYKHRGTRRYDFGIQEIGSTSQNGRLETRPGAVSTQDLYGNRFPLVNNGDTIVQTIAPY